MLKVIFFILLITGAAGAVPIANEYSGTVYINGGIAPHGTLVTASVDGIMLPYSSTVNEVGRYIFQVTGEAGQEVKFYINGNPANQDSISRDKNDVFDPYIKKTLDLSIVIFSSRDSGSGSGGGGGSETSGESASNIQVKEKYDLHIFKDMVTAYRFTNSSNPVLFINITGNISAGEVNVAVEVLKNTSTLVKAPASGVVYKSINIWVGTSGFATPRNIKNAEITFRVEKSWMQDSGSIALYRYDSEWVRLPTNKIKEDAVFEYYTASTDRFSPFAITKSRIEAAPSAAQIETTASTTATGVPEVIPAPTRETSVLDVLALTIVISAIIVLILAAIYLLRRK